LAAGRIHPHVLLTCGVRAIMVGKAKWKPLELPPPRKIVNLKQYRIPGDVAEINAIIKDQKDAGVEIPTTSPFNSLIWPVLKTAELGACQWISVRLTRY